MLYAALHHHVGLVLALSLFTFSFAPFVLGDRVLLRRPTGGRKRAIIVKNYFPFDTNIVKPITLTETKKAPPPPAAARDVSPSVPRRLLQPFADALPTSPNAQHQPEIKTEKLLDACRTLKDAMVSLGQDRNAAEIERNLQKIEALHRMAPPGQRETLRSLLGYEKELGVHGPDGKLKDPSGAMGLLWIRRSLAFQERMYSLLLETPTRPPNEVALEAYHDTLSPYHGWALQKVYSVALKKTTPPRHDFFQKLCAVPEGKFGMEEERETAQDLRKLCDTWKPLLHTWEEIYASLGLEDDRKA